jgi:diamine N-acetyltransferase
MELTFRPCSKKDLKELVSVARSTFYHAFIADNTPENMRLYLDTTFNNTTISEELKLENTQFHFAYLMDNVLAGYFKLNRGDAQKGINDPEAIQLERLYVLKEFQRKKLGQQKLEKILDIARASGAKYIWLGVWEKNIPAIRFYERNGFVKFNDQEFMMGNEKQTDHLMKRNL